MASSTPIQIRLHDAELEALDSYRRSLPNPPSRAKAVRDLFRRVLNDRLDDKSETEAAHAA